MLCVWDGVGDGGWGRGVRGGDVLWIVAALNPGKLLWERPGDPGLIMYHFRARSVPLTPRDHNIDRESEPLLHDACSFIRHPVLGLWRLPFNHHSSKLLERFCATVKCFERIISEFKVVEIEVSWLWRPRELF